MKTNNAKKFWPALPRVLIISLLTQLTTGWSGVFAAPFDPNWGTVGVFTQAETCARCHRASSDQDPGIPAVMRNPLQDDGEDISPSYQWRHSMMAHAFDDPYYQAAVEDEVSAFPALAGLIEDTCLTCHTPMAHTNAHQTGTDLTDPNVDLTCLLPDGCYRFDTASSQNHAREGISCTLCHQIKGDNLGTRDSFSGGFTIAEASDPDAFTIYGPYQNPHPGGSTAMLNTSGYTPQFGSQMSSSSHCASCHNLFTPTLGADTGTPTGDEFLEQGAFFEWQNSVYVTGASEEKQCQECHMPDPAPGAYSSRIAVRPDGSVHFIWPERTPFFTHSMVGGNTYVLELLRDNRDVLEIENSTTVAGFNEKIAQTRDLLQTEAAELEITRTEVSNDTLSLDVRITNKTGHKLPTAYPSRRMWLHVTVSDATGQAVFESGAPDAEGHISTDAGRLTSDCLARTKPPGFINGSCFEPHRDVIDTAAQVAIYETVLGDTNDHITHVLLHANSYLKDNRIPPKGFTNSQADIIEVQTKPSGVDNDSDFNSANNQEGSGTDTVHYRIPVSAPNSDYNVDVRLLYQTIQPGFVDGLHGTGSRVASFKQMYTQNIPSVETLAATSSTTDANATPVAEAGADQTVFVGDRVQLDGSGSVDADGDPLAYLWSFASVPTGSQSVLSDPTVDNPFFSADMSGTYVVQLLVNDGHIDSLSDSVVITSNTVASSSSSSSGGGGGGCMINGDIEKTDPLLPVLLLLAVTCLGLRRTTE